MNNYFINKRYETTRFEQNNRSEPKIVIDYYNSNYIESEISMLSKKELKYILKKFD